MAEDVKEMCEQAADDQRVQVEVERKRQTLDSLNLRDVAEHGRRVDTQMAAAFCEGAREALVNGSEYGWH